MKILMLATQEFFSETGTPFSIFYRVKALSKLGHKIDILTYHLGRDVNIDNVRIFRINAPFFIKKIPIGPSWTKIFLDLILFFQAFFMLRNEKYECLHVHEDAVYLGILLKKVFKIPLLYDMHSSIPEQLSHYKTLFFHNFVIIKLADFLERQALKTSDAVIVICPHLLEIGQKLNSTQNFVLIENTLSDVDFTKVTERDLEELKMEFGLNNCKIIVYIGTLEHYQGVDLLIRSIPFVIKKEKNIKCIIVGGWPEQIKKMKALSRQESVQDFIVFTGQREPKEMAKFLIAADVLVSPRKEGTNTPLKIYDYLRSGRPIVATNLYTHRQILDDKVAVLVSPNFEALSEGIIKTLEDEDFAKRLGKNAQELIESKHNFKQYIAKVEQVYQYINKEGKKLCE